MNLKWAQLIFFSLVGLVILGIVAKEWRASIVNPANRFNLVYLDQGGKRVSVVTLDPVEEKTIIITFPEQLAITSRSVGEYEIGSLHRLGSYKGSGGEFARRKVQGFMKLPIVGYAVNLGGTGEVVDSLAGSLRRTIWDQKLENNLSAIDAYRLYKSLKRFSTKTVTTEELVRAGVIVKNQANQLSYAPLALSDYVGKAFFDWGVGKEGVTVAIINESGESGLGSDIGEFLDNMGLDVITVKSGEEKREQTKIVVSEPKSLPMTMTMLSRVFSFEPYEVGNTDEYRAKVVMWVGKDAMELF